MKRLLLVSAAIGALIARPAVAEPINGLPVVSAANADLLCGYESISPFAAQCVTEANVTALLAATTITWTATPTFRAPGSGHGSIVLTPGTVSGTPPDGSLWTTTGGLFAQISGSPLQLLGSGANTFSGVQTFPAPGASAGSIVLTPGTESGTAANGSMWTTSSGLFVQIAGAAKQLLAAGSTISSPTFSGTVTLPDAGTLTSSLNTFDAPVTSAVAAGTVAYSMAGGSGTFGCMAASGPGAYYLGGGGPGGSCATSVIAWTNPSGVTLTGATAINGATTITGNTTLDSDTVAFNDHTGAHNVGDIAYFGGAPVWSMPFGGVFQFAGAGISADAASGAKLDLGNGTPGDTTGTLQLTGLNFATAGSALLPSVAGIRTSVIDNTQLRLGQPLLLAGTSTAIGSFPTPAGSTGQLAYGGKASGGAGALGMTVISANGPMDYCDVYSTYCMGRQLDFFSSTNGLQAFGLESGPNESQDLELGLARYTGSMQNVSGILILDRLMPNGAVQHYNITNGGSGYTHATATVTPTGCSGDPPGNPTVLLLNGSVYGLSGTGPGAGCSAVTVAISGDGTGATATATLVTDDHTFPAGPLLSWRTTADTGWNGVAYYGFGQSDTTDAGPPRLTFGESNNSGMPWETNPSSQPTFVIPGHIEFDTANGAGYLGFTGGESLSDAGGGVMQLQNAALTGYAGFRAAFAALPTVTVSGLSTADPSPSAGDRATVSDATACTFNASVTGGGSTACPVVYLAGAWKAG